MNTVNSLRAAYWQARAIMGFSNDGANHECLVSPMEDLMLRDAEHMREAYDSALEEIDRLESTNPRPLK